MESDAEKDAAFIDAVEASLGSLVPKYLYDLARRGASVQAAGWQRRLKHADNGAIPQWELCLASEATDHFNRSPHHEYRQISAALPTPEKDTQP